MRALALVPVAAFLLLVSAASAAAATTATQPVYNGDGS